MDDWTGSEEYKRARADIKRALRRCRTVGALARKHPEHSSVIWDVLRDLANDGLITIDFHKPAPTRVELSSINCDKIKS